MNVVDEVLADRSSRHDPFRLPSGDGATLHLLHEYARVIETKYDGEICEVVADAPASVRQRLSYFIV